MEEWFATDDFQICRKLDKFTYEFIEFNQADDLMISSTDTIDIRDWKDSDGEWNKEAQSIIATYYGSLAEMRELVSPNEEEQIVAECLFEQTSSFDADSLSMSEDEAGQYLDDIVAGKITI